MAWFYLMLAGIFEIGWPLGFKMASTNPHHKTIFILVSVATIGLSGFFLYLAQRNIPMGTAYAIWSGIGTVGACVIGIVFFNDHASFLRMISILLIVLGIVGLKLCT